MNYRHYILLLASVVAIAGCDQMNTALNPASDSAPESTAAAPADNSPVVATVNGSAITQGVLDIYTQQRKSKGGGEEASQETIVDELIALELMRQEAVNSGLSSKPAVIATLNRRYLNHTYERGGSNVRGE